MKKAASSYPAVILKPGREKPVLNRHPWIFSGAIQKLPSTQPGSIVDVTTGEGTFLARGYVNVDSQIQVRLLTWNETELIDSDFWERRLSAAISRRETLRGSADTNAYRLVYSEADLLPGLIVDRYGDWLVAQSLTAGIEQAMPQIAELLMRLCGCKGVLERSDSEMRKHEGMVPRIGMLKGEAPPQTPGAEIEIRENGMRFLVDLYKGHKTGFYLDQRDNRKRIGAMAAGKRVFNGFCYTGGFSVAAALAGAKSVTSVDSSAPAIELAKRNMQLNGCDNDAHNKFVQADVFDYLRLMRDNGERFDLIVLDPPKLAHNHRQIDTACRAYKDLSMVALELLEAGGHLATFSCSGLVDADLFTKVIFAAATDAEAQAHIVDKLEQGEDHPVLLSFPESAYLKGLLLRRLGEF